jgi:hypothetical protein
VGLMGVVGVMAMMGMVGMHGMMAMVGMVGMQGVIGTVGLMGVVGMAWCDGYGGHCGSGGCDSYGGHGWHGGFELRKGAMIGYNGHGEPGYAGDDHNTPMHCQSISRNPPQRVLLISCILSAGWLEVEFPAIMD